MDSLSTNLRQKSVVAVLLVMFCSLGCSSWPLQKKQRTSIITPAMRVAAIREIGHSADEADSLEAERLTEQLATQIRTEPDPLVRLAIQESIAEFSTPLAREVLIAGLQDEDLDVRITCCGRLGGRSDESVVSALQNVLERDELLDVRLAAIDALGRIPSPESVAALAIALRDRDPAMQYAAVQALKAVSGQDLGNDVAAWRTYAESEQHEISVASKNKSWSPF
ncbi:MAG: HEAT repeat domain-containing protein [Pirellulales bacterium]|nr:HEAT repeat domain-containing protein [Pirellulales bacterium]